MKRAVWLYALITQFIVTMIVLAIAGYLLGGHLDPNGNLDVTLAGVGLGISFFINMILIYNFMKQSERIDKRDKLVQKKEETADE